MARHQQYRETLLEKLRLFITRNLDATLTDARSGLRPKLSKSDVDLLFDNWLNANFDRIEVRGGAAFIRKGKSKKSAADLAADKLARDKLAARIAKETMENRYIEFAEHIWQTILPSGVKLEDATGHDCKHAGGWYRQLAKTVGPNEKVRRKVKTRDLFNLAQRPA